MAAGAADRLDPGRGELDSARLQSANGLVARQQANADALVHDHQILDLSVRLERGPELSVAHAWDHEVEILDRDPEQLVAHRAADEVGVEAEGVHIVDDRVHHGRPFCAK